MPYLRKCGYCRKPTLRPVSREISILSTIICYKCTSCGTSLELTPIASIAAKITVGFLALLFWGFILFRNSSQYDLMTMAFFGVVILAFCFVIISPMLNHLQNPAIERDAGGNLRAEKPINRIGGRLIVWIEDMGFLAGLFAPVIIIGGVLAVAALIGFVNFTFFEN